MIDSSSQWDRLLHNLGAWQGSFTRMSNQAELLEDIPTLVSLEGINQNQTIRQTIQHFSPTGDVTYNKMLEYSSLGRGIQLFPNGEFSQGSTQLAPFGDFGAEFGFIQGDRRLRLVELFKDGHFSTLTLIREHRQNSPAVENPPLSIEMLLGEWQGEAITIYPDWRTPDRYTTTLSIAVKDDRLHQRLATAGMELASSAAIEGSKLRFDQGNTPMQVLLLPDGASCNTPVTVPKGKPFILEAGWLVQPHLRQRMVRSYDARGGWVSLTLVTEHKVSG